MLLWQGGLQEIDPDSIVTFSACAAPLNCWNTFGSSLNSSDDSEFSERGNEDPFKSKGSKRKRILHMKTRFHFNPTKVTKDDKFACSRRKGIH